MPPSCNSPASSGGGFAVAEAATESGLCAWLGDQLTALSVLPLLVIVLLIALFITFLTEVCSNTAIATVMLPVMAQLVSESLAVPPLRFSSLVGIVWHNCFPADDLEARRYIIVEFSLVAGSVAARQSVLPHASDDVELFVRLHAAGRHSAKRYCLRRRQPQVEGHGKETSVEWVE